MANDHDRVAIGRIASFARFLPRAKRIAVLSEIATAEARGVLELKGRLIPELALAHSLATACGP